MTEEDQDDPIVRFGNDAAPAPPKSAAPHYHFITKEQFDEMRQRGELLESAEVHGNYYGTPRKPVEQALANGQDMMFDIDWQGTKQICEKMRKRMWSACSSCRRRWTS